MRTSIVRRQSTYTTIRAGKPELMILIVYPKDSACFLNNFILAEIPNLCVIPKELEVLPRTSDAQGW